MTTLILFWVYFGSAGLTSQQVVIPGFENLDDCYNRAQLFRAKSDPSRTTHYAHCVEVPKPDPEVDFEAAAKKAMEKTNMFYCNQGKIKGDEFWIRAFCKDEK